jgi:hypothetical protein
MQTGSISLIVLIYRVSEISITAEYLSRLSSDTDEVKKNDKMGLSSSVHLRGIHRHSQFQWDKISMDDRGHWLDNVKASKIYMLPEIYNVGIIIAY